jgi:hypothetical protein
LPVTDGAWAHIRAKHSTAHTRSRLDKHDVRPRSLQENGAAVFSFLISLSSSITSQTRSSVVLQIPVFLDSHQIIRPESKSFPLSFSVCDDYMLRLSLLNCSASIYLRAWACICGSTGLIGHCCREVMASREEIGTPTPLVHERVLALRMMD